MISEQDHIGIRVNRGLSLNKIIAVLGAAILCVSILQCSRPLMLKPSQESVERYVQDHPDLPMLDKQCISNGRFEIGILQSTLFFLMGKPDAVDSVKRAWAVQEHWKYNRNGQKIFIIEDMHVVGILAK